MDKIDFATIEKKWREKWEKEPELYQATDFDEKRKKLYILVEFPYLSGEGLHMGHAFSMTATDIYARFKRMQGYNVLCPMGFDAFGLPAENYAIKKKINPNITTQEGVAKFTQKMKELAFSFDWSRTFSTTDPEYYHWTQWIFLQLFKNGLAYKKEMPISWCPSCKIGLANEEVVNNCCERCGATVGKKKLNQWIVKITDYADKLIEGLEKTEFIEKVKKAQINWIGKSEGATIKFEIRNSRFETNSPPEAGPPSAEKLKIKEIEVFTTRSDTLFGVTFMVLSPESELVEEIKQIVEVEKQKEITEYQLRTGSKTERERAVLGIKQEKTGVDTGIKAINPANNKEIPIWISDYVVSNYGSGAIMSVPAHDQRDWEFARKFGLEIIPVLENKEHDYKKEAYEGSGLYINSEWLNGLNKEQAIEKMIKWLEEKGAGQKATAYHLRDWIFSRQHYWGEPIPMIFCQKCDWVMVPEEQLPVVLPNVEHYEPTETGESPLAAIKDWVEVKCPVCGAEARRETDTMPNWAGSDWYFARYTDPHNKQVFADEKKMRYWLPVDVYIGGDEHNTLHLLYSRFIYKFLFDLGYVPTEEPYFKRVSHGVILGTDGFRMSKSRGNVLTPEVITKKYGVDATRMALMFLMPFEATGPWSEKTVTGVKRFLERFYGFCIGNLQPEMPESDEDAVLNQINKTIEKVTDDLGNFKFNTATAQLMKFLNFCVAEKVVLSQESLKKIIQLLAPFAPYLTEELWGKITQQDLDSADYWSIHASKWPNAGAITAEEEIIIPIEVNGKLRAKLTVLAEETKDKEKVITMAKQAVVKWLANQKITKEIYVPGRMVSLVIDIRN